jgi:hypothetical protein
MRYLVLIAIGLAAEAASASAANLPVLRQLRMHPASFLAARGHGASVAAAGRSGTMISYTDSRQATTRFTVFSVRAGSRVHHKCVARRPWAFHHFQGCTRLVALGDFVHADAAGANSLHFTGRMRGAPLRPGSYVLGASARLDGKSSRTRYVPFRIVRRRR